MFIKKFDAIVTRFNKVMNILCGIDIVVMFVILMFQIFSRFIIFVPLPWSQDVITFFLVVSVFLGACGATANGNQIRLEFFVDYLPEKIRVIILTIADLISIAFLIYISLDCVDLFKENIHVIVGASPITFGWYYLVTAIGCIAMAINFLNLALKRLLQLSKKGGEE